MYRTWSLNRCGFEREGASALSHCIDGGSIYWAGKKRETHIHTHAHTQTETEIEEERREGMGEERRKTRVQLQKCHY